MKRPAFQFYPADWRKDPALSSCSLAARGLWIELMCIAHESDRYGYLSVNGRPMGLPQLARMVGESPATLTKLMSELESAAVFSREDDGTIYSRRMIKDERIRNVRAAAGKKGGNPNLVGDLVKQNVKQSPTPSSSSSSSSSKAEEAKASLSPAGDPCPHSAIVDLYHEMLPANPRIKVWDGARADSLRARWREDGKRQSLDYWRRFFAKVAASAFLTGRTEGQNGRPFLPGLEWMVKAANFAKIIEGRYDDRGCQ